MNVRRIEIDYQTGTLTVDADVSEEFGREFEFELATLPDIQNLVAEVGHRSQLAVVARLRSWLHQLEEEVLVPPVRSGTA